MNKIYQEDDWIAEVEILEDLSDDEYERYNLKVIRTIQESRIYKPTQDGEAFIIELNKKYSSYMGGWSLRDKL